MSLIIKNQAHYDATIAFAKSVGLYEWIAPQPDTAKWTQWREPEEPYRRLTILRVENGAVEGRIRRIGNDPHAGEDRSVLMTVEEVRTKWLPLDVDTDAINALRYLKNAFAFLNDFSGDSKKTSCDLFDDGPMNFYFNMYGINEDGSRTPRRFNGGLLFHGPADGFGSGAAPTFAVTLEPVHGWHLHT